MQDDTITSVSEGDVPHFSKIVSSLSKLFSQYSIQDITELLFVSSVWLPNNSTNIKHIFFYSVFSTINESIFPKNNKIKSYSEFKSLLRKLYNIAPSFPTLENYLPEFDWGQIKYFYRSQYYKIFYGTELSNIYDYMELFHLFYEPINDELFKLSKRSPIKEFELSLNYQNELINSVQQERINVEDIKPGDLSIPSSKFWMNARKFYKQCNPKSIFPSDFLNNYSIDLGTINKYLSNKSNFEEKVYTDKIFSNLFIRTNEKYYLIHPRRIFSLVFDAWTKIFIQNESQLKSDKINIQTRLGAELHKYMKERIDVKNLKPFVSIVEKGNSINELTFSTAYVKDNDLILIYITNPLHSEKLLGSELELLNNKIKTILKSLLKPHLRLALHLTKEVIEFKHSTNKLNIRFFIVVPNISLDLMPFTVPNIPSARIILLDQFIGLIDSLDLNESIIDFFDFLDKSESTINFSLPSLLDIYDAYKNSGGVLVEGAIEPSQIFLDPHGGSNTDNNFILIILIVLCVSSPFNFALSAVGKEFDDQTIYLILKTNLSGFEIAFSKTLYTFFSSLLALFLMYLPFYLLKITIMFNIELLFSLVSIIFIFSFFGTFVASLVGHLQIKPFIGLLVFIFATALSMQFGAFTPEIREGILKIPWFNSLAILYQVLNNGKVPWFYIYAYLPFYIFLIILTGRAFLWHARK